MLNTIRVFASSPPIDAVLRRLGRLNVIAGKNNSGKSSLLNALANVGQRAGGAEISKEVADSIAQAAIERSLFRRGSSHDFERTRYHEHILNVLSSRELWFSTDSEALTNELSEAVSNDSYLRRHSTNVSDVTRGVLDHIGVFPASIAVPAKRRLELDRPIKLSETIDPTGEGLLNYLFFAKNQPAGTEERKAFERMSAAFEDISSGYRFDVFANRDNNIKLNFARRNDQWITAGACGLGLQDLLVLLYFVGVAPEPLLLVEEPESHMHPDMQRRLLSFIRDATDKQLFVTTHSNVFLNNVFADRVFFTTFDGSVHVDDATSRASILDDLGYSVSDNLVSDLIILVEGPTDRPVVEEFLSKDGLLRRFEVKVWPLGGDIMDQVDLTVFAERYSILAVIDGDPDSDKIRRRFERKCQDHGIEVHRLTRYSIENYFTVEALRKVFGRQLPVDFTVVDEHVKLTNQLGFDVKKRNRHVAREMQLTDLEGTDLGSFFARVREVLAA